MELERDQFEEVALTHFVAQRAAGVQISGDNGCEPTRESLFWRTDEGDYGVRMFNAAWWGWREAAKSKAPSYGDYPMLVLHAALSKEDMQAVHEYSNALWQLARERAATEVIAEKPASPWLGPYKDAAEALNELRKACAEMLGCDDETWPRHGNACLAIASALALRDNKAKTADQLKTALNELVNRTAPICESNCGPGMDAAFWDARRVLGLL